LRDASYERGGFWQVIDRGQWQVAGSAPEVYERELVPAVFGPWTQVVVYFADLRSGDRVLDVACGPGVVARIAAEKVGEREALLRPISIRACLPLPDRSRLRAVPRSSGVKADAAALPFPDHAFDVVFCQLGLQFFADRVATLREMCRVRCPGVRSWLWSGTRSVRPPASPS
jgi:ubiquinone/menaquinone biosynthesis C-methylase UbiE